jgi:hypothetical protein
VAICSAFRSWFEEQAGKPKLNEADYLKLMHETVPDLRAQLANAERELAEARRYRTAKQYALYAWTAKPNTEVCHGAHVSGPRTITVNGELCEVGNIYVDPSGFVITPKGKKVSGRGANGRDQRRPATDSET